MRRAYANRYMFGSKKLEPFPASEPATRFAVIIPARNEAAVIGGLLEALKAQEYPAGRIDAYVAVNHCTDRTEAIASGLGAGIIRCSDGVRCKGDVLREAFDRVLPMPYDAYAVFDSDNLPAPDFFQRMNDALAAGERVCRSRLKAGNAAESWVAGCYGLNHTMMEYTYSLPRTRAGLSSNLVGTAFVIHREVLERMNGWHTISISEDSEFAAQCSRMGVRVCYVPEALSYDEQVTRFPTSLRQRRRWCYGTVQASRAMVGSMFRRDNPDPRIARDFGMLMLGSFLAPVTALLVICALAVLSVWKWYIPLAALAAAWVTLTAVGLNMCRLGGYPPREMVGAILLYPLFTLSWIPLHVLALFAPVRQWSYIEHTGQDIESAK